MKKVIIIWTAALITGVLAYMFINGQIFAQSLSVKQINSSEVVPQTYNPQKTTSGYKLQTTVSDAYLQWGENPQKTAPASVLETATEIN